MGNILVRQANVVLDIPESQRDEYLAKGFDVIGADGKAIMKATPNDPTALKKAYEDLKKQFDELQAEYNKLKEQMTSKPAKKAEKKEEEPIPPEIEEPVQEEVEEPTPEPEPAPESFTPINKRGSKKKK